MREPSWVLEADPKKPYKMYAGIAAAMLTTLLTYAEVLPLWVVILVNTILTGLFVFSTGNPLRIKDPRNHTEKGRQSVSDDPSLW